jgi:hypothetical protein
LAIAINSVLSDVEGVQAETREEVRRGSETKTYYVPRWLIDAVKLEAKRSNTSESDIAVKALSAFIFLRSDRRAWTEYVQLLEQIRDSVLEESGGDLTPLMEKLLEVIERVISGG